MNVVKLTDTIKSRECWGAGAYLKNLGKFPKPTEADVRFSITSGGENYVINMSSDDLGVMISGVINSDHILIMKQILKEMGEI